MMADRRHHVLVELRSNNNDGLQNPYGPGGTEEKQQ